MVRRFLLVDDDQDDIDLFGEALMEIDSSIEFHFAHNGEELLAKLHKGKVKPDVIFLDINMSEMNGWECFESMKKQRLLKDAQVIMYSTSSPGVYGKKAVETGAIGFYEKPPNFLQLRKFLESIARSSPEALRKTLVELRSSKVHKVYSE